LHIGLTTEICDRRRKQSRGVNGASESSFGAERNRAAAVRLHRFVKPGVASHFHVPDRCSRLLQPRPFRRGLPIGGPVKLPKVIQFDQSDMPIEKRNVLRAGQRPVRGPAGRKPVGATAVARD